MNSSLVWPILLLSLGLTISTNNGVILPEKNHQISGDDDILVPYQGERFTIFDWNLCKEIAKKYRGNFLISPVSLKIALILLYEGALDQTAQEIARVLHLPANREIARNQFSRILQHLQPITDEYQLNLATRIFMSSSVITTQSYASIIKSFYFTDIIASNFSDFHSTTQMINSWVQNATNGNLKNMIEDDSSIEDSVMLMINVLFFKGLWYKNKFDVNATKIRKFHETNNKTCDVPFINAVGNFYYTESLELDAKILRIPYVGHRFAMYLILPRTLEGLDSLIKNIDPLILTRHVFWLMKSLPVDVKLPKFKFEFTSHLEPVLREMGIHDIFENSAILTSIAHTKRNSTKLMVSDIIQKAGIEVNEEGTTAHAATEVNIGNKVGDQEFIADHPFLFYIEDERTGTILYMGRVTNPSETTGNTEASGTQIPQTAEELMNHLPKVAIGTSDFERYNFLNAELLQAVNEASDGNIVISPLSVKSALTILSEGTGGKTRQELLSTLRLPSDPMQIRAISRQTLSSLQPKTFGTEIDIANRLWVGCYALLSGDFNNLLMNYYGGDTRSIDFRDTTASSNTINEWVRQVTRNHITSLVDPGTLSTETQLLLTSALYFRGKWLKAFDESSTRNLCFRTPKFGCQNVPMMENIAKYRYADIPALDAQVVEIPYADGKLSMIVLLPKNKGLHGLQTLTKDLSHRSILSILASLEETEILIQLPRFSIESKMDLRPILESLGIHDLFNENANLTGILSRQSTRVDKVLHNAKIEVNEIGTVAAAVTGFSVIPLMGSSLDTFRADRPFLFTIVDRQSGSMIFAGRVIQPLETP